LADLLASGPEAVCGPMSTNGNDLIGKGIPALILRNVKHSSEVHAVGEGAS
jgi:hypothetical protein